MSTTLRQAVIPVAGLGTRLLPATKALPKELLPLWNRPALEYVVAEAVAAGLEDIVFVTTAWSEELIRSYFSRDPVLEARLEQAGKGELAREVRRVGELARVRCVRQDAPLGLGHAVLQAAPLLGAEDFAVMLADDLVVDGPGIGAMVAAHRWGEGEVALIRVPPEQVSRYGIADGLSEGEGWRLRGLVEKPAVGQAPSELAVIGRYLLPGDIHQVLSATAPGRDAEIQLTDALAVLAERGRLRGLPLAGRRLDCGTPLGRLEATLWLARGEPGVAELLKR